MLGKQKAQKDLLESFGIHKVSSDHVLMKIDRTINWRGIEIRLEELYPSKEGRPSYPPLMLFKALLLAQIYNLSDPELEEMVRDRLSFQKFLGLSISEETPDETTYCRFRARLMEARLYERLFRKVNEQLGTKGLLLKKGSIVDASLIESDQKKGDSEGKWTFQKGKTTFGYKLHVSCDEDDGLIQEVEMTPASTNDSAMMEAVIPKGVERVFGDKGYASDRRKAEFKKHGIYYGILRKAWRNRPLHPIQKALNRKLSRIRYRVETVFAHLKGIYGYRKVRYRGVERNRGHAFLLATAYNLWRAARLVPSPA
jgi:IS5 family transposase